MEYPAKTDTKLVYDSLEKTPIEKKQMFKDGLSLFIFFILLFCYAQLAIYAFNNATIQSSIIEDTKNLFNQSFIDEFNKFVTTIASTKYTIIGHIFLAGLLSLIYITTIRCLAGLFVKTFIIFEYIVIAYYALSIVQLLIIMDNRVIFVTLQAIMISYAYSKISAIGKIGNQVPRNILKESCRVIFILPSTILVAFLTVFVTLLTIGFGILVSFYIMQTGKISNINGNLYAYKGCVCPQDVFKYQGIDCLDFVKTMCKHHDGLEECNSASFCDNSKSLTVNILLLHLLNITACTWISAFIFSLGCTIISKAFAMWYWTENKKSVTDVTVLKAVTTTIRYHAGIVVYGCSPWAIVPIIIAMVRNMKERMSDLRKETLVTVFSWFDILFKLSDYGTFFGAIHSNGFQRSTNVAGYFAIKNSARYFVLNKIFEYLSLVLIVGVGVTTSLLAFCFLSNGYHEKELIQIVATICIGVIIIIIPTLLLLYVSINTILLCISEDYEKNNGSLKGNYYMSNKLKKLLVDQ